MISVRGLAGQLNDCGDEVQASSEYLLKTWGSSFWLLSVRICVHIQTRVSGRALNTKFRAQSAFINRSHPSGTYVLKALTPAKVTERPDRWYYISVSFYTPPSNVYQCHIYKFCIPFCCGSQTGGPRVSQKRIFSSNFFLWKIGIMKQNASALHWMQVLQSRCDKQRWQP